MKKVSQSLIKDIHFYQEGSLCGNILQHKWIKGKFMPPSDVMRLGHFFEYIATGALPKDGNKPEPDTLQKTKRLWNKEELRIYYTTGGKPGQIRTKPTGLPRFEDYALTKKGINEATLKEFLKTHETEVYVESMSEAYRRAYRQAHNFKQLAKDMGIELLEFQEYGEREGANGVADIKAMYEGQEITIDLKYSGLIHNDFERLGWGAIIKRLYGSKGFMNQMEDKKIQALHYEYVFERPFYYWIFSSATKAEEQSQNYFIRMVQQEESDEMDLHIERIQLTDSQFKMISQIGFDPRPEYNTCLKCELLEKCEDAHRTPRPIEVEIM